MGRFLIYLVTMFTVFVVVVLAFLMMGQHQL
jgi:hypothetical protein